METLQRYISEGEHENQDFKLRIDDSKKIAITLSAFSNTTGGRLLIGVKDNGKISGVKDTEEEFHMVKAAAEMYCKPSISVNPSLHRVDGKDVLVVDIPEVKEKPISALNPDGKWRVYQRVADENFMINSVILKSMRLDREKSEELKLDPRFIEFLKFAETQEDFGFNLLRKRLKISTRKTEYILATLIHWNVLKYKLSGNGVRYVVNRLPSDIDLTQEQF